jgi:hypothetical protein
MIHLEKASSKSKDLKDNDSQSRASGNENEIFSLKKKSTSAFDREKAMFRQISQGGSKAKAMNSGPLDRKSFKPSKTKLLLKKKKKKKKKVFKV